MTLGSNTTGTNVVNYFAAAVPAKAEVTVTTTETTATTTTTTTTTTTATTTETTAPTVKKITGDVDENEAVDVRDAVLLARIIAEEDGLTASDQARINAECDGVMGVDAKDLMMLLQYLAHNINEFPV